MALKLDKATQEKIKQVFIEKALPLIIKALEEYQVKESKK